MNPHEPQYTREELIAALGVSPEYAEKMWNAFGFAHRNTGDKIFSQTDVDALKLFASAEETMPMTAQLASARAIGQTMARLADWQADQIRELDRNPDVPWTADQMAASFGQVQNLIWRRHLDLVMRRDIAHDADVHLDRIVGFADIVGYTSLSRRIAMDELEQLIENFEESTHDVVSDAGGFVVKTLGDAVMFLFDDPGNAAQAALGIHHLVAEEIIPEVRVGLARGQILTRLGDVFGEPVNIAARLCGSARPGTTLVDDELAEDLADDERFYLKSIPTLSVRGYRKLKAKTLDANKYYEPPTSEGAISTDSTPEEATP